MIAVYCICIVISAFLYLVFFLTDVKKSICQHVMLLINIAVSIANLGIQCSDNLSSALVCHKIVYLGGCFLPLLFFFTVCEICHCELKRIVKVSLILIQICLYGLVCTIGFSDIYYKSIELTVENGIVHFDKVYGPLHFLYPLSIFAFLISSVVMGFISLKRNMFVHKKEIGVLLVGACVNVSCYVIQRVWDIEFDMLSAGYIFLMIIAIVPVYHSNLYTVDKNMEILKEQLSNVGFITFARGTKYMGANAFAVGLFEELVNYRVGRRIEEPGENLIKILKILANYKAAEDRAEFNANSEKTCISINDEFYQAKIYEITDFRHKCVGFTIELRNETEHHRMVELTEKYNEELSRDVELKARQIMDIQEKTILGMAQMVESRDLSTGGHIKRTSDVVRIFSRKILEDAPEFDRHFLELVIRAAPMHDLGKIGVDDAVLRKQGKFTGDEYNLMKKHAEIGGKMVRDILTGVEEEDFVRVAYNVANYHHEKVNGTGYPSGLKGDEIPVEARIMALADVFDALVSKRCYKEAFSYDKAFSIIEEDAGKHFDSKLAELFLSCRPALEEYYNSVG